MAFDPTSANSRWPRRSGNPNSAKAFTRAYAILSSVLPYNNPDWEERSIFLNFLIPKLPAPEEPDLSKGILERIDMDSYRVEKHKMRKIILDDEDAEIDPVQTGEGGGRGEIETDRLSAIIDEFNNLFGGIEWGDLDRVIRTATEDIPAAVAKDAKFKNAWRHSDRGERPRRIRQGDAASGAGDDAGRHPTLQALRRQPGLPAVAVGHRVPAGLQSDGLRSAGRPAETLRGCLSAPLATTAAGFLTLLDLLRRYRQMGDSGQVDLPAGGYSAFQAWKRGSTSSARG